MDQAALERDVAELRRQVRELTDRNEIAELIAGLARYLDEKRFDEARSVFTEDAIGPFGDRGVDLLAERSRRNHAPFEGIWHLVGNYQIELDGDRATARAAVHGTHVKRANEPDTHYDGGSFYHLDLARTPDGWRIAGMSFEEVWRSGAVEQDHLEQMRPAGRMRTDQEIADA
jgi:SnoaL-like domain